MAALNLEDVWQWHTPRPKWGLVQLQVPTGFSGSQLLDGRLKGPIPTRVLEDAALFGDIVATGWASVMVISPAVQAVLAPYKGWEAMPLSTSDSQLSGYAALSIIGRVGPITEDHGGLGSFVDPSSWDGKALFKPENRRGIWTTGEVASALLKATPSGLEIDRHVSWEAR